MKLIIITLDKVAKYYGVSYTGTGIDFGYKYSGNQVARLVRGADFVLGHRTPSAPVNVYKLPASAAIV